MGMGNIRLLLAEKNHINIYNYINDIEKSGWRENSVRKFLLCKHREPTEFSPQKIPKRDRQGLSYL